MVWLFRFCAIAAIGALAGCVPPPIPYDREVKPEVKTIGVVTPGWPSGPVVFLPPSAATSLFGLPAALIELGIQDARQRRFRDAIAPTGFDPKARFTEALVAGVAARGYTARHVPMTRRDDGFAESIRSADGQMPDAWLDCVVGTWGYWAAGHGDEVPYRPTVGARCHLLRPGGTQPLMRETVWYNQVLVSGGQPIVINLPPDPEFAFTKSDDLIGNPQKAVEGAQKAIDGVADTIGGLLK